MSLDSAFTPACPREAFVETAAAGDALRRFGAGLGAREPFLLVTGEPGTGKTALVREAVARWGDRVVAACLAYPALTGSELLEEIVRRFGAEPAEGASRPQLMACLERALAGIAAAGKVAVVVVDDAQQLPTELLEELRLLANAAQQAARPFEVLLAGLPALEARLDEPALAALRERIAVRVRLEPLGQGETRRYLRHRLDAIGADGASVFPRKTSVELGALAHGLPRRINALAAEALRVAHVAGAASVLPRHLHTAAAALWGEAASHVTQPAHDAHDAHDASAHTESAATLEPAPPPVPPAPAPPVSAAPIASAPPPVAPPPVAAPRAESAPAPTPAPKPAPPARQDPGEWVARFVGDRGPVRIGSLAAAHSALARDAHEPIEAASPAPARRAPLVPATPHVAAPPAAAAPRHRGRRGHGLRWATHAVLAASAIVAVVMFVMRFTREQDRRHARTAAVSIPASAPRIAVTPPAPAPVVRVVPSPVAEAAPRQRAAAIANDPANDALTSPTGRYTLEVGEFPTLSEALDERALVHRVTGMEAWVIPAGAGGSGMNRVVLGVYRSHERAAAGARLLLESKTLPAAKPAALPPRGARL